MSTVLPIIGAASGAAGSIEQGFAQANAASYQAAIARNNAIVAQQNAGYSAEAGSAQIEEQGEKSAQQDAAVRTGLAANGVDVNSGSAADVQVSQRKIGALDTATVAQRAAETVYGYQTQKVGYQAESNLDQAQEGPDIEAGFLKAGSIIGSAAPNLPKAFGWMGGNPTSASGGDFDDVNAPEAFA